MMPGKKLQELTKRITHQYKTQNTVQDLQKYTGIKDGQNINIDTSSASPCNRSWAIKWLRLFSQD